MRNTKKLKICTIIGARPQFVKAAVVSQLVRKQMQEIFIHTGQHYDYGMSDIFFEEMNIPEPEFNLNIGSGTHGQQTGKMIAEIENVIGQIKPDFVMVYGDTNSTLAGAIAAVKLHIPIIHVEAGLRSFNRNMPEEINRLLTDQISTILFAPTELARNNLLKENVDINKITICGDVMYDAALKYADIAFQKGYTIAKFGLRNKEYILATIHRAENTDNINRLQNIFDSLNTIAKDIPVILPLHPRTRQYLSSLNKQINTANLQIINPIGYLEMITLEKHATLIVTDSGGVQKEAYFYRIPCVTLRDETEWVELIEAGWNRIVSPESSSEIIAIIKSAIGTKGKECDLYGEGNASEIIESVLLEQNKLG